MPLRLYFHPLASFCWKPLIALYENGTAFEPEQVELADEASATAFRAVWPLAKFPVLRDDARQCTVAESTTIIEYLDAYYPGPTRFVPGDADCAWRVRMWDRIFDNYVQHPMQKIVADRLRPEGGRDPLGVKQARSDLRRAYSLIGAELAGRSWITGETFTLADCAAAPALFYADVVEPFGESHPALSAYLGRLMERPSFARVLDEAEPYFPLVPVENKPVRHRA